LAVLADERTLRLYLGADATPVYSVTLPDAASGAPALDARGTAYVPLMSGAILAIARSGTTAGCEQIAGSALATPLIEPDGTVLIAARGGVVAAVVAQ
jgi:hypothetical protein